jgi:hypothetical protein
MGNNPLIQNPFHPLQSKVENSQNAWKRLGIALRSVTLNALGRALLVLGVLAGLAWLAITSWPRR